MTLSQFPQLRGDLGECRQWPHRLRDTVHNLASTQTHWTWSLNFTRYRDKSCFVKLYKLSLIRFSPSVSFSLFPWLLYSKYLESISPKKREGSHMQWYLVHSERRTQFSSCYVSRSISYWVLQCWEGMEVIQEKETGDWDSVLISWHLTKPTHPEPLEGFSINACFVKILLS